MEAIALHQLIHPFLRASSSWSSPPVPTASTSATRTTSTPSANSATMRGSRRVSPQGRGPVVRARDRPAPPARPSGRNVAPSSGTNLRDTINILAKHRPIDFEVYKMLEAECDCDLCRDLFKDYLDFSEGLRTDISLYEAMTCWPSGGSRSRAGATSRTLSMWPWLPGDSSC